jgi:hypothetical protein
MNEHKVNIISEEDLKNKVLLPYLNSIGYSLDDLSFEKEFSVRLGKTVHKLASVRGRLDILCKKGNDNLFVIEAKASNVDLNPDDVEQGISYARLLHPIAPFVVVTNGKNTKVVDTLTRAELSGTDIGNQSSFWKNGCRLSLEEELQQRYEALKHFIGYSTENLIAFSRSQVNDRM